MTAAAIPADLQPVELSYRNALREFFKVHMADASKIKLHNMAMDANNDGTLTFGEAYSTMRDMGFTRLRCFLLSGLTAFALAPQTSDKGFTTKLNVANNSLDWPSIVPVIQAADLLLCGFAGVLPLGVNTSLAAGQQMVILAKQLEEYNTP